MNWIKTTDEFPPEGIKVLTSNSGGNVQPLIRKGRIWFFPDMSMYVYYTPTFWKPVDSDIDTAQFAKQTDEALKKIEGERR